MAILGRVFPPVVDLKGTELLLDADADTTITADTDDQIDIKIAGADDFQFTANTFTAQSGSTIAAQALTATTGAFSSDVTVTGDLTVSGDDLTMGTNTSGAALIADGTNFNPVVISGDISINTSGVAAIGSGVIVAADIASNAVTTAKINADAVTGAKIADDAIDSEHYADGSIDTAHIADDAITLAKMASGTDGNIISYDASGNPVAIATGTDGQVLTSTGAGSPPAFEDAAGGGSGATDIDGLSDALVENNSIYLGNDPSSTTDTAEYNVAVGITALDAITTGDQNVAIGYDALTDNTTGGNNSAFGHKALYENISGPGNTAIGYKTLYENTSGTYNTATGLDALRNNSTGDYNTAAGPWALYNNTTANYNTAFGINALQYNTTGANNIAIGAYAGDAITTGSNNTIIGDYAGSTELASTVAIAAGTTERIKVDSNGLYVNGSLVVSGSWNLIDSVTADDSASLTVTGMDDTYDQYCIIFSDFDLDTDNDRMNIRMGDSSGIDSGSSDYAFWAGKINTGSNSTFGGESDQTADYIEVGAESFGSATGEGFGGVYWITSPSDSATMPKITGQWTGFNHSGQGMMGFTYGKRNSDITLDRIQIFSGDFGTQTGNIVTGRATLWGIAHA